MPATSDYKRICNPPLLLVLPTEYKNALEVCYLKNVASVSIHWDTISHSLEKKSSQIFISGLNFYSTAY